MASGQEGNHLPYRHGQLEERSQFQELLLLPFLLFLPKQWVGPAVGGEREEGEAFPPWQMVRGQEGGGGALMERSTRGMGDAS